MYSCGIIISIDIVMIVLWCRLESVRMELLTDNKIQAMAVMAKALQVSP